MIDLHETKAAAAERRRKFELYHSFARGWSDGAGGKSTRREYEERTTRADLRETYERGYGEGQRARREANASFAAEVGYRPTILRAEGVTEQIETAARSALTDLRSAKRTSRPLEPYLARIRELGFLQQDVEAFVDDGVALPAPHSRFR